VTLDGAIAAHGNDRSWRLVSFRSIFRQRAECRRADLPLLGVSLREGVKIRQDDDGRPAASDDLSMYKVVRAGDVVMNRLGKPHGSVGVSPYLGITSPAYWVMEVNRALASPRYVHYLLRSQHLIREYSRLGKNMPPNQFDISWDSFRSIEVPLPPLGEQQRIADFLDEQVAAHRLLREALVSADELATEYRVAIIDNVWEKGTQTIRLGYRVQLATSGSRSWAELVGEHGDIFFRSANLRRDGIEPNLSSIARVDPPAKVAVEAGRARIRRDDVLIGITGANAGWVSLANSMTVGGYVSQHVCLVRPANGIYARWLAYVISSTSAQQGLFAAQYGGTKTQLSLPDVRNIRIPVYGSYMQHSIADRIDREVGRIEAVRGFRTRQASLLDERLSALIIRAVTGELDVTAAKGLG
jgi:type I restriction enzyme S subunit